MIGKTIEPAIKPLGFNWKIGIGLITSLAAREVIVGTLGTIYGIEGNEPSQGLQAAIHQDLSPAGAVSLAGVLRVCSAVFLYTGGGEARNRRLEMAVVSVLVHAGPGVLWFLVGISHYQLLPSMNNV